MPTAKIDGPLPATVAEIAARYQLPHKVVLERLNRALDRGEVIRSIDRETSVARWDMAAPPAQSRPRMRALG